MSETYLIYVGQGASLFGVPARNLSKDETFIHGEGRLLLSGLYKLAKSKEYKPRQLKKETKDEVNNE